MELHNQHWLYLDLGLLLLGQLCLLGVRKIVSQLLKVVKTSMISVSF